MKVLIIEPNETGHRFRVVRHIASAVLERGDEPILATLKRGANSVELASLKEALAGELPVLYLRRELPRFPRPTNLGKIHSQFEYRSLFGAMSALVPDADVVVIPYFDYCDKAFALASSPFGRKPYIGVTMRQTFHHLSMGVDNEPSRLDRLEAFLFRRLLSTKKRSHIFSMDIVLPDYVKRFWPQLEKKVSYLPDPVEPFSSDGLPNSVPIVPEDRKVLLVYGTLTARKGIAPLLDAASSPDFPQDVTILFVGRPDDEARTLLTDERAEGLKLNQRISCLLSFATPTDEEAAFKRANAVWVVYVGHTLLSGVLRQAISAGLPVVASAQGLIGYEAARYPLSFLLHSLSTSSIVEQVSKAVRQEPLRGDEVGSKSDVTDSLSRFKETIKKALATT